MNETGDSIGWLRAPYEGGVGIRVIPAWMLAAFNGRPAVEDRRHGIDGTMLARMRHKLRGLLKIEYHELHRAQIVDWKSSVEQIWPYRSLQHLTEEEGDDPFRALAVTYPVEALEEMRSVYRAAAA